MQAAAAPGHFASIRARLLLSGAIAFLPIIVAFGITLWDRYVDDREAATHRALEEARLLASRLDDHLNRLDALLIGLSRAVSSDPSHARANDAVLRSAAAEFPPYVNAAQLFDLEGRNIGSSAIVSDRRTISVEDRPHWQQSRWTGVRVVSDPILSRITGEWIFVLSRPVFDDTGRVQAVITAATRLDRLQEILKAADLPNGTVARVINKEGRVLGRTAGTFPQVGESVGEVDDIRRHIALGEAAEEVPWKDGHLRITGSVTLAHAPWLVSVGFPRDFALSATLENLRWGAGTGVAALLLVALAAWVLADRISRPLRQLAVDTARLTGGNYSHRTSVRSASELGTVADAFNLMAASLELRQQEQENANRDLLKQITERRRAEATLRDMNDTLSAVIEAAPFAIICLDNHRRVLVWNRAAEKMFGFTADEVVGEPYRLVPPGGEAEFDALFRRALGGEVLRDMEVWRRRKDGSRVQVSFAGAALRDSSGDVRGVAYALQDMTARNRADEELRRTRKFLDLVIENIPYMLFVKDAEEHRFVLVNRAGEELLGMSREELVGKNDYDLFPREQAQHFIEYDREVLASGTLTVTPEEEITTPKNGTRLLRTKKMAVPGDDGRPLYLLGISEDITERKKLEEQLHQSQKMEAIGQLTGGLSHDFNNLLAIIIGNLDLLKSLVPNAGDAAEITDEALNAALRGAELNRRLLAFARRQPLQPKRLDMNELVTGMVRLLKPLLGEAIEVELSPAPELWPVIVDPAQLESSIANLATNARDAMPRGGRLIIATRNTHLDDDYAAAHPDALSGDYAAIEVTDTGEGMPPEVIMRALEPFFTTKQTGKGTGLGLSMVFGFVKQSGGHLKIYSEPGCGTTVRLYLPRAQHAQHSPEPRIASAIPRAFGGEVVLAVEDDERLRRVLLKQLGDLGYTVLEASHAKAAIDLLRSEKRIDLLLTDIVMPGGMNGCELAIEAQNLRAGLKVLFTSGFPDAAFGPNRMLREGDVLLSKPYRKHDLAEKVRDALAA